MSDYILEMREIEKIFPGVKALKSVNLRVKRGEVHAICGENGAGKSTLIKILAGVHPAGSYSGEILLEGEVVSFAQTSDAEKKGIVCIHQELELIPELTVGENVFLGNYPAKYGIVEWDRIYRDTKDLLEKVGIESGVALALAHEKIRNIGIGQQQLVEIAKALARHANLLVLDEPTAALTGNEVDNLLGIISGLRDKGITCIYISHKLDEVIKIADSITVLRDGECVGTDAKVDLTKNDIIAKMVGRQLNNLFPTEQHEQGECVLAVKDYSVWDPELGSRKVINSVSFEAHRGEILGVSGLMGAGRTELFSSLFGAYGGRCKGQVHIDGKPVNIVNTVSALKNGIFLVTEDRKRFGLVLDMDIKCNTVMASLEKVSRFGFIDENAEVFETRNLVEKLTTKVSSVEMRAKTLSGGNQQKVVLQKALLTNPKLLILDEPTRGIDVGAKFEIYKIMNKLVADGVAIIMISSEMEEIIGMSDRILVMSQGQITAEYSRSEATQEKIMYSSIGGRR